jgi:hypothetical protein
MKNAKRLGVLAVEKKILNSHINNTNHGAAKFIKAKSISLGSETFN